MSLPLPSIFRLMRSSTLLLLPFSPCTTRLPRIPDWARGCANSFLSDGEKRPPRKCAFITARATRTTGDHAWQQYLRQPRPPLAPRGHSRTRKKIKKVNDTANLPSSLRLQPATGIGTGAGNPGTGKATDTARSLGRDRTGSRAMLGH